MIFLFFNLVMGLTPSLVPISYMALLSGR